MSEIVKCMAKVREAGSWPRYHPCGRNAVTTDNNGTSYCKIHSPEYIAQKNKKIMERWEAEDIANRLKWDAQAACKGMRNPKAEVAALLEVAAAAVVMIQAEFHVSAHHRLAVALNALLDSRK